MLLAETLSRHHLDNSTDEARNVDSDLDQVDSLEEINEILNCETTTIFQDYTTKDQDLQQAKSFIQSGWPESSKDLSPTITPSKQPKKPLIPHEMPKRAWAKIGCDIFEFENKSYLVTVDYYSNFFEVDCLEKLTSLAVIKKLKPHFARFGIPNTLVTDNGPQFISDNFRDFSMKYQFEHITTSPYHHQSNGKAESATPLPVSEKLLQPKINAQANKRIQQRQQLRKKYHDRGAKELSPLRKGEVVRLQPARIGEKKWKRGIVVREAGIKSYEVQCNGYTYTRNRFIRRSRLPAEFDSDNADEEMSDMSEAEENVSVPIDNDLPQENPQPAHIERNETNTETSSTSKTRSGRLVKKPDRL
ncbi:Retrovirus-related Pol poly from transposon, partial [Paramuricea clavata]